MINVGSDFSGVGAFDQALRRLNINYKTVFSCDMDLYARETYMENYGEPQYYPFDVYDRKIPKESLDIYMTSPPCQAFSLAGKRNGENDKRGVLFYNSHEFIQVNKPRYFIFENVKGLLSDAKGRTFQIWLDMLGGKSVNGNPVIFPREDATPYHIYHQVLNAKNYGVPQNRERVFIIGIRDDKDNTFNFPKKQYLNKTLKDVLESDVDEKYFLSEKMLELINYNGKNKGVIADLNKGGERVSVFSDNSDFMSCLTATDYKQPKQIQITSATKKGFEVATDQDSINFSVPNSETRRVRVGKGVAQTLDTACNQGVWIADYRNDEGLRIRKDNISPCMTARRHSETDISTMPALLGFMTNNKIIYDEPLEKKGWHNKAKEVLNTDGLSTCIHTQSNNLLKKITVPNSHKIRRLTPRECFRLMDFPENFKWSVSNTQAYKQAGNSIVVNVLAEIIKKLNF